MDLHDWIRWTAWPALVCYGYVTAQRLSGRSVMAPHCREIWTLGGVLLCVHIWAAWHYFHHNSWAHAWTHTATQTELALGWNWGGGVWLNLLTATLWVADAIRLWAIRRANPPPNALFDIAIPAYLGFMIFNATIVFGSWPARLVGSLYLVLAVTLWWRNRFRLQLPKPSGTGK